MLTINTENRKTKRHIVNYIILLNKMLFIQELVSFIHIKFIIPLEPGPLKKCGIWVAMTRHRSTISWKYHECSRPISLKARTDESNRLQIGSRFSS